RATAGRPRVHTSEDPLTHLLQDRPGDVVILAGKNDRKLARARRLHDAGLHVLADKPWLTTPATLADIRHVLSGGARTMEMMTGRHASTSRVADRLVGDREILGDLATADGGPAIRLVSVHHLEKVVNGAPLRRPPWYFDVRVQGDGLADIPTHLVDQAQRFIATHGVAVDQDLELLAARRWSILVPRALFARVTGQADFSAELGAVVEGDALAYAGNAELSFRAGRVAVHLTTRWDLTEPPGGGDAHSATITGTASRVRIEQGPGTGFRRRLWVEPRGPAERLERALKRAVAAWQAEHPGLEIAPVPEGFEVRVPAGPGTMHEAQFPLVLDEFLRTLDRSPWPDARAAVTLAKYDLLARALAHADQASARAGAAR
ncbi:MAG TPA: putative oxidoreductase C-terminal domain-containing protein, partial [Dongiaceae bacterium]|nr:putative oxidoreductase C-terminal domain-containing protein [Dongiaceae bacterium]